MNELYFLAQPAGQPEICRISLSGATAAGGEQLFVIGKNFVKGFQVKFQEIDRISNMKVWEDVAEVDMEFVHTVCKLFYCVFFY